MATSGTVGNTVISCGEVLDHAFRRCRLLPEIITSQHIATAKKLLWMLLTNLNSKGVTLWAIDTQLVGLNYGLTGVTMPTGGIALLNSNLRQIQRIDGSPSSSGGFAFNAYDQNLTSSCVESAPNGSISIAFTTNPSPLTQVGILPASSGTWSFDLKVSTDGATYTTAQSVSTTAVSGKWLWYDIDGYPAASNFRLQATNGTTLAVYEIVCGNTPSDIPMSPMARDTWTQLPNKQSLGRPVQYYWDRRLTGPLMHIWPAPDASYQLTWLLVNYVQRQLQDVGTMAQQIELPDRWYLAVIADLARNCAREIKEVDPSTWPDLDKEADRLISDGWDGETSGGPVRFLPNIGCYTA